MFIDDTCCCAMNQIDNLSGHRTAKDAMLDFCERVTDDEDDGWDETPTFSSLAAFYVFSGEVKRTDGTKVPLGGKYGPNFADFIKRNKLGSVVCTEAHPNRVNHPKHIVKIWVWHPDLKRLMAWRKKHPS